MKESRVNSTLSIHHVGIVANDPERSIRFYEQLLGGTAAPQAGHTGVSAGDGLR